MGTVYLLHLKTKLAHAQHYIGYSENLKARLWHHKRGTGSKFMAAVVKNGIDFVIAKTWKNVDRHFERRLKKWKKSRQICPICNACGGTVKIV